MALIEFKNVTKWFPHSAGRALLRTHIANWFGAEHNEPGESLAVVGRNGAGKSTLLSLAAGLATPNEGQVTVNGQLAALLELGSGFHPDLTGAENLLLNSALLGRSRKQTLNLADKIVDFSGIRDFINDPLRNYSSGMVMRLAFSIAIHTDPDVLMLDEVLAVGDAGFQVKCRETMVEFQRAGKSILFVSHSAAHVRQMCERAIWLDHGRMVMEGDVDSVLEAYDGGLVLAQQAGDQAN
jgi:ABC-type polysaccharide/polyol phosphate transport system ATPase subunit